MIALRERGIIASDSVEDLIAVNATASESFPAVEMLTPADETGEAFTPAAIEELDEPFVPTLNTTLKPTPRRTEPAMTREKMWTWFAIGGALWLIGFIILGVWLGGCLDSKPASRPSKTQKN